MRFDKRASDVADRVTQTQGRECNLIEISVVWALISYGYSNTMRGMCVYEDHPVFRIIELGDCFCEN